MNRPWDLPVGLLDATRAHLDRTHALLAEAGHPGARPMHGFALQAVGEGTSIGEVASRLGVTKQAAAKTVAVLETQGYLSRRPDPEDARRTRVERTSRGEDFLAASVTAFAQVRREWGLVLGEDHLAVLEEALAAVTGDDRGRLDLPGWVGQDEDGAVP